MDESAAVGGGGEPPAALWVDTDGGSDDALALLTLAAAGRPPVGVSAVQGVVDAWQAAGNAAGILARAGVEVVVHVGRSSRAARDPGDRHGHDGVGGTGIARTDLVSAGDGVEALLAASHDHRGLRVLALGPLTNIAAAIAIDPDLAERLGEVVVAAGAATPHRDTNTWCDPEAMARATRVLAGTGRLTIVPTDATGEEPIEGALLARLATAARYDGLPWRVVAVHHRTQSQEAGRDRLVPHDALASVATVEPVHIGGDARVAVHVAEDRLRPAGPGPVRWITSLTGAAERIVELLAGGSAPTTTSPAAGCTRSAP